MKCRLKRLLRLLPVVMALTFALPAYADDEAADDEASLDVEFATPEVPKKQHEAIVKHIAAIRKAVEKKGFKTGLERDGEVLTVVVPCGELFAPNATELKDSVKTKLQLFKDILKYPTMYKVIVAVFSDDTGEPDYCRSLTTYRADAVAQLFDGISGVADSNILAYGMGQDGFLVDNNSIANRALNRRLEIYILPEWQMIETAKSGKLN